MSTYVILHVFALGKLVVYYNSTFIEAQWQVLRLKVYIITD